MSDYPTLPEVTPTSASTLTNKTLTSPVIAGTATGSAAPIVLKGGAQTESATASGLDVDTPASWVTTGNMLRLLNNGTVRMRWSDDGTVAYQTTSRAIMRLTASGGDFIQIASGVAYIAANAGTISQVFLSNGSIHPQATATGDLGIDGQAFRRLRLAGTAPIAGDFALSAGWGTTASVGTIVGNDSHATFVVTSTGTGQGANPTITLTFKNGTWTTAPFGYAKLFACSTAADLLVAVTETTTATTMVITFNGTPVATRTYSFKTLVVGT
jgi:hypothetical protein